MIGRKDHRIVNMFGSATSGLGTLSATASNVVYIDRTMALGMTHAPAPKKKAKIMH